uniref:Uncharacterized protein n=1 Tax=Romanomermis culicivorax TaxID=13658 RepID=A0A915J5C5_ROMCU
MGNSSTFENDDNMDDTGGIDNNLNDDGFSGVWFQCFFGDNMLKVSPVKGEDPLKKIAQLDKAKLISKAEKLIEEIKNGRPNWSQLSRLSAGMANWRLTSKALLVAAFKDPSNFDDGCSSILVVAAG